MPQSKNISRLTKLNCSCRQVLNIMVILGFMLNYALRVNLTIAIVEMVVQSDAKTDGNSTILSNATTIDNSTVFSDATTILATTTAASANLTGNVESTAWKYNWTSVQQNLIHGSFFWGYILTELPGGRLAELIGGRRVFGHSMLWASVLTLFTPAAAYIDYKVVVFLRALLGLMLGASWPAIHPMTAVWIKPMDRSKFMANMMASSLGAALAMPVCGFLISFINWESVFYFTGGLGLIWSILWFIIIFETPATHPRISPEERREIEEAIGTSTSKQRPSYVPRLSMLSSPCVWAIIITHGCSVFGYFTVVNQLPTYMKTILHYNIKENGLLSSLPYLGKYVMAVVASYLADYFRQTGKMTTTQARKSFTAFAVIIPGLLMILQVFFGMDRTFAVIIFTLQLLFNGAVTAGYLGNGLDIAPNFSGTIFGMANTLSSLGGFLSAYMVGKLTEHDKSYGQWQIVFGVLAATYIFGGLFYVVFGKGELQKWNTPPKKNQRPDTEEALPLKKNNVNVK